MMVYSQTWLDCHDLETGRYCKVKAAQAKRKRKNAKRARNAEKSRNGILFAAIDKVKEHSRVVSVAGKTVFFSINAEQEWIDREAYYDCTERPAVVGNGNDEIDQEHLAWLNKMLFGSDQP